MKTLLAFLILAFAAPALAQDGAHVGQSQGQSGILKVETFLCDGSHTGPSDCAELDIVNIKNAQGERMGWPSKITYDMRLTAGDGPPTCTAGAQLTLVGMSTSAGAEHVLMNAGEHGSTYLSDGGTSSVSFPAGASHRYVKGTLVGDNCTDLEVVVRTEYEPK